MNHKKREETASKERFSIECSGNTFKVTGFGPGQVNHMGREKRGHGLSLAKGKQGNKAFLRFANFCRPVSKYGMKKREKQRDRIRGQEGEQGPA